MALSTNNRTTNMNDNIKLAELVGSEAQIKWAESIREKMLETCAFRISTKWTEKFALITSAAWFIHMRDRNIWGRDIVRQLAKEIKPVEKEEKLPADYDENEHYYTKLTIANELVKSWKNA